MFKVGDYVQVDYIGRITEIKIKSEAQTVVEGNTVKVNYPDKIYYTVDDNKTVSYNITEEKIKELPTDGGNREA